MKNVQDASASPALGSSLYALFVRDMRAGRRIGGGTSLGVVFFLILVTLSAFAVGPDLALLGKIAPAILWISGLLATLLGLDRLFQADHEDGSLDLLLTSGTPLELIVLVKCLAHWILTGLPLAAAAPFFGLMLDLPTNQLWSVTLSLIVGTPALTLIGAIGAALTVSLRRGGLLFAVLILPLCVPVLIFGVAAAGAGAGSMVPFATPFSDPLRPDPDRDRRRAFRGGFCFAADKHVSSVAPGHENPEPVSEISRVNGHSLRPADMIGENRSKHSKFDRGPYPFENSALEGVHENISADHLHFRSARDGKRRSIPGADDLSRTGEHKLRLADDCETMCRTNANACRTQCADPEEQEQCIVNCGKSECKAGCDKFERACKQHCPSAKG